jgi:hypothetical protein
VRPTAGAPTPHLRQRDGRRDRATDGSRATATGPRADGRPDGQPQSQPPRLGEVVVGLAHALADEVPARGGQATHEEVERPRLPAAERSDRADQLEVLEEHVAVVAPGREEGRPAQRERARVVGRHGTVQQRPAGVPSGVPRQRVEVVLRAHEVVLVEQLQHPPQRRVVVAHVVVCDDQPLVAAQPDARRHPVDLAVEEPERRIRTYVGHDP